MGGCAADDNDRYAALESAATELGAAIAATDEITVMASQSSCPVPSSCPDSARVDLPERTDLSLNEIVEIATNLGWSVDVVDDRVFQIDDEDENMSGSVRVSADGKVLIAVGED